MQTTWGSHLIQACLLGLKLLDLLPCGRKAILQSCSLLSTCSTTCRSGWDLMGDYLHWPMQVEALQLATMAAGK